MAPPNRPSSRPSRSSSSSAASGATRRGRHAAGRGPGDRRGALEVADATRRRREGRARRRACADQAEWAATRRPRARRDPPRAYETHDRARGRPGAAHDARDGQAVAESKAEITYAAEFFRWFAGRRCASTAATSRHGNGAGRVLAMRQPVGPCLHHALELPAWRWARARSARRSPPAARWSSSRRSRRRSRCSRWPRSSRRPACPRGVLNVITATSSGSMMGR